MRLLSTLSLMMANGRLTIALQPIPTTAIRIYSTAGVRANEAIMKYPPAMIARHRACV